MSKIQKILIADDDPFMLLSLKTILDNENYSVIESADGNEAVAAFKEHLPDCVLLDGLMPNLDGFSACNEIRALQEGKVVPILIVSGLTKDEVKAQYPNTKATGYIHKPIDWEVLLKKLNKL